MNRILFHKKGPLLFRDLGLAVAKCTDVILFDELTFTACVQVTIPFVPRGIKNSRIQIKTHGHITSSRSRFRVVCEAS